jgi:hypothetical protein
MENRKIKVINLSDEDAFEIQINKLLSDGWDILSTNCGFCDSEKYDFCSSYQAILINPKP